MHTYEYGARVSWWERGSEGPIMEGICVRWKSEVRECLTPHSNYVMVDFKPRSITPISTTKAPIK